MQITKLTQASSMAILHIGLRLASRVVHRSRADELCVLEWKKAKGQDNKYIWTRSQAILDKEVVVPFVVDACDIYADQLEMRVLDVDKVDKRQLVAVAMDPTQNTEDLGAHFELKSDVLDTKRRNLDHTKPKILLLCML